MMSTLNAREAQVPYSRLFSTYIEDVNLQDGIDLCEARACIVFKHYKGKTTFCSDVNILSPNLLRPAKGYKSLINLNAIPNFMNIAEVMGIKCKRIPHLPNTMDTHQSKISHECSMAPRVTQHRKLSRVPVQTCGLHGPVQPDDYSDEHLYGEIVPTNSRGTQV
ncbi:hypothetical protein BdWA1_003322 [Babesia duncani]|uniref:Uncharacterized protein n=1 Tax=Babesia duncani TaxID=323732 RepID=A0AAD9UND2_9APIC|nr:hypothetical protein BdWA1_003322 [Babesia duncani]